jgi:putative chitinase
MGLTYHFTLEEMTHSQAAARLGLDNTPPPDVLVQLRKTALGLEMVRALVQCPVVVSSGYRSPSVNQAVGGARSSQHMLGRAADITAPGFGRAVDLVRAIVHSPIPFDQCIWEFGSWCHISFDDNPRRQALVIDRNGVQAFV